MDWIVEYNRVSAPSVVSEIDFAAFRAVCEEKLRAFAAAGNNDAVRKVREAVGAIDLKMQITSARPDG